MSFKCLECGHIFEEGEQVTWREDYGEIVSGCPHCRGAYEETVQCAKCCAEFLYDELQEHFCPECVEELKEKYRYSVKRCYDLVGDYTQNVRINDFLASILTANEIEDILLKHLLEAEKNFPVDCSRFIEEDEQAFLELATIKEVKPYEKKR